MFAPDGLFARKQGGAWIYYAFDLQGNVSQRFGASGALLSSSAYDAYGQESTTAALGDSFGFNGRWG